MGWKESSAGRQKASPPSDRCPARKASDLALLVLGRQSSGWYEEEGKEVLLPRDST